jgi:hypothetical protein
VDNETKQTEECPAGQETASRRQKLWGALRQTASKASQVTGEVVRESAKAGQQLARCAGQTAQDTVGKIQRKLGEDYYAILEENPLVKDTMSRADLLVRNEDLLQTVFNIPWVTTLLWSAAAGSTVVLQRPIAGLADRLMHDGPGHVQAWDAVNKFMDSVSGSGHRLKFGHSVEHLPQIVEHFGIEGVPAFFLHLAQDFTSPAGIPIVPNAWDIKTWLGETAKLPSKAATGLVSISFSSMLSAIAVMTLVRELWKFGEAAVKKIKVRNYIKTATAAVQNRDYNAAAENYKRALEIERSPAILMALGQVYMQRASNRLRAHQAFTESVTWLADRPASIVPYGQVQLSVRGLAGIQALATADVLADIHPEHWNDYVQDLVNATVFSFASAAAEQAKQSEDIVPDAVVTPAHFSAAINYYLAAKAACYYPLAEERCETVVRNLRFALQSLGLMAQYDEEQLRQPAGTIRQLWAVELLQPDEIEIELATY